VTIIDVAIVVGIALLVAWGFWRGLTIWTLALAGFGVGAVLGSRVAPLVLKDGLHSTYAPILAFPGALLFGGILAAAVERLGFWQRRRLDRLGPTSAIGGALLAGCLGVMVTWMVGAAAAQVDSLKDPIERSAILERLNAVLPPFGPLLTAEAPSSDPFPTFEGPIPRVGRPDPRIVRDPEVRTAGRSVVRIESKACGGGGVGSGWIAADGIVATNAHVVAGEDPTITLQVRGEGTEHPATVIWWDPKNDLALLRTPGVKGVPALPLVREPKPATSAAMLGFPGGRKKISIRPGRFARATNRLRGRMGGTLPGPEFPRRLYGRPITLFASNPQSGNSGGPLVDTRGRVVTTVFGGGGGRYAGLGVPNRFFRTALRRAGPPVDTGSC